MKKLWYSKKVKRNDGKCRDKYDKIEEIKEEIREKIKNTEREDEMKKGKIIVILVLLIILGGVSYGGIKFIGIYKEYKNQVSKDGEEVEITIDKGTTTKEIAKILKEDGLIQHELAFVMKVKESDYAGKLRYGTFQLHKGMSIEDILKSLSEGGQEKDVIKIVVPEGYTVQMIAKRVAEAGLCTEKEFLKAANTLDYDFSFLKELEVPDGVDYVLQGFLFPATYEFKAGTSAESIVKRMLQAFDDNVMANISEELQTSDQSLYDIINIAAIIEREAKLDEERPTIAGVIYNRLKIDMKLQMCPTVLYPLTEGQYNVNQVLYSDLTIDSSYNTYKNKGLPIGPICNPGLASIEAALNPESHEYLFYHTDGTSDGKHIFTKTYEEHEDTRIKKD